MHRNPGKKEAVVYLGVLASSRALVSRKDGKGAKSAKTSLVSQPVWFFDKK
jgi:hypothetical protein